MDRENNDLLIQNAANAEVYRVRKTLEDRLSHLTVNARISAIQLHLLGV